MTQRDELLLTQWVILNELFDWNQFCVNYAFNNLTDQIFQTDNLMCSPVWFCQWWYLLIVTITTKQNIYTYIQIQTFSRKWNTKLFNGLFWTYSFGVCIWDLINWKIMFRIVFCQFLTQLVHVQSPEQVNETLQKKIAQFISVVFN